jgi:hypothetical protein
MVIYVSMQQRFCAGGMQLGAWLDKLEVVTSQIL